MEFADVSSVSLAMGLNGQKLLGVPIIVQQSQAEKNRLAGQNSMTMMKAPNAGPMRLYVGSLHFNITEDMLKGIFEPFGRVSKAGMLVLSNIKGLCYSIVVSCHFQILSLCSYCNEITEKLPTWLRHKL